MTQIANTLLYNSSKKNVDQNLKPTQSKIIKFPINQNKLKKVFLKQAKQTHYKTNKNISKSDLEIIVKKYLKDNDFSTVTMKDHPDYVVLEKQISDISNQVNTITKHLKINKNHKDEPNIFFRLKHMNQIDDLLLQIENIDYLTDVGPFGYVYISKQKNINYLKNQGLNLEILPNYENLPKEKFIKYEKQDIPNRERIKKELLKYNKKKYKGL